MKAHAEPVRTWGLEPCEGVMPSSIALAAGQGGARVAPRPAGLGRGNSEVQTSLNSILRQRPNGRRHWADGAKVGGYYELETPLPATAPPAALLETSPVQGGRVPRSVGNFDCSLRHDVQSGVSGDLGKTSSASAVR